MSRTAAKLQHHLGREFQPPTHAFRIDGALETIAGVRIDAGLATRRCNVSGFEPGALDKDAGGRLGGACRFTADDAGKAKRARVVGDDTEAFVERVGLAVERLEAFAGLGHAGVDSAHQLIGIKDVQRAGAIIGDEIGDIDQRVDRPQTDGAQSRLQPIGRRPVLDAGDQPAAEHAASLRLVGAKAQRDRNGAVARTRGHRRDLVVLQRAKTKSREVAGNTVNPGAIAAIGGDGDVVDDAVDAGDIDKPRPDLGVLG